MTRFRLEELFPHEENSETRDPEIYDIKSPHDNNNESNEESDSQSTIAQNEDIIPTKKRLSRPSKRNAASCNSILQTIDEHFKKPKVKEDRYDICGKNVSFKLRDMSSKTQQLLAEKLINEVLFMAEMNQLTLSHTISASSFSAIATQYPNISF
ncbi:hypothetical protein ABEB36_000182 [Hypothenemus hampei]|uniref:Uncharacterized protein n=1 Tax=Hypothenemus hampei TaxID=57062 RepID=A0ABD1FCB3_HYPHA